MEGQGLQGSLSVGETVHKGGAVLGATRARQTSHSHLTQDAIRIRYPIFIR